MTTDDKQGQTQAAENPWQAMFDAQASFAASFWRGVGDAMSGSTEAMLSQQDGAAKVMSDQFSAMSRAAFGLSPQDMIAGSGGEWSPQAVAMQSFGMLDKDAASFTSDMTQLSAASAEAARTMFELSSVVNKAWVKAAEVFAGQGTAGEAGDPASLQRQWVKTAEPILQKALASDEFVQANARFIRAASRQATLRSAFARRFTDFIEAPNRQEMEDTYEAIQDLRREVRDLRRNQKRLEQALAEKHPETTPGK